MTVPTAYTEAELKTYLIMKLGEIATILGWTTATPQLGEAVSDTLLAYGLSDIAGVATPTGIAKLRALGAVMVWRAAVLSLSARFDFTDAEGSYKRSQAYDMALRSLALAEADAAQWGIGTAAVRVQNVVYPEDPYAYLPADLQTVLP